MQFTTVIATFAGLAAVAQAIPKALTFTTWSGPGCNSGIATQHQEVDSDVCNKLETSVSSLTIYYRAGEFCNRKWDFRCQIR